MDFTKPFNETEWVNHLGECFIRETFTVSNKEEIRKKFTFLKDIKSFGTLRLDDSSKMPVYILQAENTKKSARVKLTSLCYRVIKEDIKIGGALFFILYEGNSSNYRFSYVKHLKEIIKDKKTGEKKVGSVKSDPKRYTYILGKGIKTHTPETRLKKEVFTSEKNIEEAFSVEPVNKEFYKGIKKYFDKLNSDISKRFNDNGKEASEFSLRFLGRLLFCWFLKEKELIPKEILKIDYIDTEKYNYYKEVLRILFFNVLNETIEERTLKNTALEKYQKYIPFLNGGLFSQKEEDKNVEEIDNAIIEEIFNFFEKYNFTVDESTPVDIEVSIDPEMLGRIFENLLAEINPETKEAARKETGSFYTPREIVDYMVVESLKLFLKRKLPKLEEKIDKLFLIDEENNYSKEETKEILKAIHDIKILDPACGSGAFPIGILQRVFYLINKLDTPPHEYYKEIILESGGAKGDIEKRIKNSSLDYIYKLDILQTMIHGVDIQPIATELSRLRAFLSLIVEEDKDINDKDNLGIEPLPNLEFQFITANTLISLKDNNNNENALLSHTYTNKIINISKKYFNADTLEKKIQIKGEFTALKKEIKKDDEGVIDSHTKAKLLSWDPFENKQCEFFSSIIQFGIESFDIVIGNPPYIQLQKMKDKIYEKMDYSSFSKRGDIYQLFYEKSARLLNNCAIASLITSNKWLPQAMERQQETIYLKTAVWKN